MGTPLLLALRFKNEKGDARSANVYVNFEPGKFWSSDRGTYWSSSAWVGTLFDGKVTSGEKLFDTDLLLKNGTDGIVAIIRGGVGTFTTFGDTGSGRLYKGCSGAYPVPFDFAWECIATYDDAVKKMTSEQAAQDTAIGIGPFTTP